MLLSVSTIPAAPFGGFATTFAPVGSVSLDSQSPKGSLRIQFPCHPAKAGALWALGSGNGDYDSNDVPPQGGYILIARQGDTTTL